MSTTCSDQFIIDPRWIEPDYSGDARPALHSSTATLIIGTSLITISAVWLLLRYARLLSREISALISLCEAAREAGRRPALGRLRCMDGRFTNDPGKRPRSAQTAPSTTIPLTWIPRSAF